MLLLLLLLLLLGRRPIMFPAGCCSLLYAAVHVAISLVTAVVLLAVAARLPVSESPLSPLSPAAAAAAAGSGCV
jgi:hypothetical protein